MGMGEAVNTIDSQSDDKAPDITYSYRGETVAVEIARVADPVLKQYVAQVSQGLQTRGRATFTRDPTPRIIEGKLNKKYISPYPIELFCYFDRDVITPDDDVCFVISDTVATASSVLFRKIWYFGERGIYRLGKAINGEFEESFSKVADLK